MFETRLLRSLNMNISRFGAAAICLLMLAATGGPARGAEPKVNAQHFEASPHGGDMLMIRTAARARAGFSGGFLLSYARDPFIIEDGREGVDDTFGLVEQHSVADLFAAFGVWDRLSVGLNLPVVMFAAGETGIVNAPAADAWGLGDVRLGLRFLLLPRDGDGLGLGIDADAGFPTAMEGTYAGSAGITATPRFVLDYAFAGTLLAMNAGYRLEDADEVAGFEKDGGLVLGLGVRQGLADERIQLLGELSFLTSHWEPFSQNGTVLEGQVGANTCVGDWARVYVAGGGGFVGGVGEAGMRLTSGVRFERCKPLAPEPEPVKPEPVKPKPVEPKPVEPKPVEPKPVEPKPVEPVVPEELLEIAQRIQFETNKTDLLAASKKDLDEVAAWIVAHPKATLVRVEGHTDNVGAAERNLELSAGRAQAVVDYLVSKGVPSKRLEAKGFGAQQPIGENTTEAGRKANRRVEFKVFGMESDHE